MCSGTVLGWVFMISVGFNAAVRLVNKYILFFNYINK